MENNVSAISYEQKLKDANLQNNLFQYVSGGIRSPQFLTKNFYTEDTKEIEVDYINLEKIYKKNFTNSELDKFKKMVEESQGIYEKMLEKTTQSLEEIIKNSENSSKVQ